MSVPCPIWRLRGPRYQPDEEAAAKYFMSVALLFNARELVPEALYRAGMLYNKTGNTTAATQALAELQADYADSPWAKKAANNETGN